MHGKNNMKIGIVILNYDGRSLLQECLPSILDASKRSRHKCSVTVIDNASSDDSIIFLEKNFSEVYIDKRTDNRVLCGFNGLLERCDDDICILLNNDMKVDPDFVDPLVDVFDLEKNAFLAVPKIMSFDGSRCESGRGRTGIRYGMFWSISRYPGYEKDIDKASVTSHSANGAFNRKRFVSLGGFDDLYLPGIMEDADLCFRAYKKGFKCYYQPKSVIYHKGRESFKKVFREKKIDELAHRNTFLFMWKNIADKRILAVHVFFLIPRILYSIIAGKVEFVRGFFRAITKFPEAMNKRKAVLGERACKTDAEIFREIGHNSKDTFNGKA